MHRDRGRRPLTTSLSPAPPTPTPRAATIKVWNADPTTGTVNTGTTEDLVFFWVFPANAGHDYGSIERQGFRKRIVARDGVVAVEDNPRWLPPERR